MDGHSDVFRPTEKNRSINKAMVALESFIGKRGQVFNTFVIEFCW